MTFSTIKIYSKKVKALIQKQISAIPLVDLKGIEPSNLTDANRALSQLSYKPICRFQASLL